MPQRRGSKPAVTFTTRRVSGLQRRSQRWAASTSAGDVACAGKQGAASRASAVEGNAGTASPPERSKNGSSSCSGICDMTPSEVRAVGSEGSCWGVNNTGRVEAAPDDESTPSRASTKRRADEVKTDAPGSSDASAEARALLAAAAPASLPPLLPLPPRAAAAEVDPRAAGEGEGAEAATDDEEAGGFASAVSSSPADMVMASPAHVTQSTCAHPPDRHGRHAAPRCFDPGAAGTTTAARRAAGLAASAAFCRLRGRDLPPPPCEAASACSSARLTSGLSDASLPATGQSTQLGPSAQSDTSPGDRAADGTAPDGCSVHHAQSHSTSACSMAAQLLSIP